MQKIIRRTAKAQRVVARQKDRAKDHQAKGESWERNQQRLRQLRELNQRMRDDRKNRRTDWETGALAPRRDVGELHQTYGAVASHGFQPPEKDPAQRPKWMHLQVGDRVVLTRGRDKGKIGVVDDVSVERAAVQVRDLEKVNVDVPLWLRQQHGDEGEGVISASQFVSINDVRLVHPLPDPESGAPRDVIIDRLICINRTFDKNKKEWDDGDRVIPGTNTIIPWPEKADPRYEDYDDDTLRITVEEQTFRPFLIRPPMPLSVIDELRNKYSRFRTRHDYEYRTKKELEDDKEEERKGLINTMRTPLQQLAAFRAEQKAAQPKELSDDQLARIGEVIAQEQAKNTSRDKTVS